MCDLLTFANINNGANLQLPLDTQKQKSIQLQGALPPDSPPGALPPWTTLGAPPPDSCYRVAPRDHHEIRTLYSSKLTDP